MMRRLALIPDALALAVIFATFLFGMAHSDQFDAFLLSIIR